MSFTTFTMKITAFLTLVTSIKCATSSEPALKSRGSIDAMSVKNQPANIVRSENKNFLQVKEYNGVDKFMTNFEDKTIRTKVHYDTDHYHFNDTFQPQNVFKCPPCICKNISSNLVSVYCKDCIFTSIPQNWSFEIEEIIIINCDRFEVLDLRTLVIYTFLTRVQIITRSLIEILSSSSLNVSTSVTELDLTYNSISKVEDKSFLLLPNLLKLSLPLNKLKGLTKQTFTGLNSLLYLSVSRNEINFIAHDTFDDLGNLLTLDISHNKIIYTWNDLLPSGIFNPLRNLEELYINDVCRHGTYQCGTYPNRALQVLKNLRLLKIDEADTRGLGPEIKSLLRLRHLIIDLPVSENFKDESFFDNVPSITTLEFSSTETKISPKAFTKLTKLVGLTNPIRFGRSNICEVLSDMKYFVNSSLKYLTLRNVNTYKSGCRKLKAQDARYLTLFKLIELDLSENDLHDLSPDFIKMLPATLQKFDLSYNGFYYKIIYSFSLFPKDLVDLNLNNQKIEYCECHDVGDITPRNGEGNNLSASNSLRYTRTESENYFQQLSLNMSKNGFLPKLHILRADNFRKFGWTLQLIFDFLLDYQVKELSLAGGEFKNWDLFYLTPEIKVADFSSNYAESFNIDFFPENSLLEYLSISNNFLGPAFQNDSESLFFVNTKKLIELEMSRNFITELAGDYFRNLENLQILDISQNKLQMINISFSHMTELRFLDFSSNSITSISKQSRDELDIIASDHRMYILYLARARD